jgi:hypothetical protein
MLAMDVVDTLRRKERLVQRELDSGEREQALKERLRKIYAAQGIEVSDAILAEGVRALEDDRFAYKPPEPSLGVTLARIYVSRGVWGKWVLGALAGLAVALVAWQMLVVAPRDALPERLQAMHAEVTGLAVEDAADAQADRLLAEASGPCATATPAPPPRPWTTSKTCATGWRRTTASASSIAPVNAAASGAIPDANTQARNYYLIVEAVGPRGQVLRVPITNEETGKTETVDSWGLRVDDPGVRVRGRDKGDDGIIQADLVGRKAAARLEPDYRHAHHRRGHHRLVRSRFCP